MPPRRDNSSSEEPPTTLADHLAQLVTLSTTTNTQLAALITATENLNAKFDNQSATTARLVNHVAELSDTLHSDDHHPPPHNHGPPPPPPPPPPPLNLDRPDPNRAHRPPKISLPMFDGTNPLGWIFQAENYFTYFRVPHPDRVTFTAFHCTGDALAWYQNLSANNLLGTWPELKRKIELRFGPSAYENHEAALFKLQQTTTVADYLAAFEKLSNRVTGLNHHTLLNCFISGLKPAIRAELAIHQPVSLHAATGLARLLEDKFHAKPYWTPKGSPPLPALPSSSSTSNTMHNKSTSISPTATTTLQATTPIQPPPSKPLPFHKLAPEAIAQRRKDGLCFRCPAKYSPGHVCSPPQFLIIVDPGDSDSPETATESITDTVSPPEFMSLSTVAFYGTSSPQTLRVTGSISGKPVTVLIDCCSTHNIIQPRIAQNLKLPFDPMSPFPVMVGNGAHITCEGYCPSISVHLNKVPLDIPFFIFPIHGADVVLGIAWLATLGPLGADFSIPQLSFTLHGITTTLRGEVPFKPVSTGSLSTLLKTNEVASLHTLMPVPDPLPTLPPPPPHPTQPYSNCSMPSQRFSLHPTLCHHRDTMITPFPCHPAHPPSTSKRTVIRIFRSK